MIWRLIPYRVADPAWNMAVDEALFRSYLEENTPPVLRFYGWSKPTISIGYFQDTVAEINLARLRELDYGLVRRTTGGRAVLHDCELTYAVIGGVRSGLPLGLMPSYLYISHALIEAFSELEIIAKLHQGMPQGKIKSGACFDAPSWYELMVAGKKLVGSAQYRQGENFLQHGSILLDFDAAALTKVLNLSSIEASEYAAILQRKVTSFADLGVFTTLERMITTICLAFQKLYQIEFEISDLTSGEYQQAQELMELKYATDNWNLIRGNKESQLQSFGGRIFA